MGGQPTQRRLTAIVATDTVGYLRLMEADEEGTLAHHALFSLNPNKQFN